MRSTDGPSSSYYVEVYIACSQTYRTVSVQVPVSDLYRQSGGFRF